MLYVICLHLPAKVNSLYVQTFRANKPILILIILILLTYLAFNQNVEKKAVILCIIITI